jgi:hypothetical protein
MVSARPGTGDELGREKPAFFQCRSNLSSLSNQNYKERRIGFTAPADIFSTSLPLPRTTDKDFACQRGQVGQVGLRQQRRSLLLSSYGLPRLDVVGSSLDTKPEFTQHRPRPSNRGPIFNLVFRLRICFRFPFSVASIET